MSDLHDALDRLLAKWEAERLAYPAHDPRAHIAFATVKLCEEELAEVLAAHPPRKVCGAQTRSWGMDLFCRLPVGHTEPHRTVQGASWKELS